MNLKALKLFTVAGAVAVAASACGKASPAQPSSTNGGSAGTSYVAAGAITPADKAQVAYASQPITIVVSQSTASSGAAPTYSLEVATDAGFSKKVFTTDGGGTSQTITAKLPGSTTYYWHTKVSSGSSVGPFGPTYTFAVGPEIQLGTPAPVLPLNGGDAFTPLTLTVANVSRSGPASNIQYKFDVSTASSFASVSYTQTVAENAGGQTSASINIAEGSGATLYWRVTAIDASGVTSPTSAVQSFRVNTFNWLTAGIYDSPPDLGSWPETARITTVDISPGAMIVDFDRRDGPNRWPDQDFGDGLGGSLQYTLGMCAQVAGQWACSSVVQFWYGRDLSAGASPYDVGREWFYDVRWGPLIGHQPAEGETVGFYVQAGNGRNTSYNRFTCPGMCERSNIALVPFTTGNALYTFSRTSPGALLGVLRK